MAILAPCHRANNVFVGLVTDKPVDLIGADLARGEPVEYVHTRKGAIVVGVRPNHGLNKIAANLHSHTRDAAGGTAYNVDSHRARKWERTCSRILPKLCAFIPKQDHIRPSYRPHNEAIGIALRLCE